MTDGDSAEVTDGESAEDAAWRDLIGRFDAPAFTGDAPAPWPASEDLGRLTATDEDAAGSPATGAPGSPATGAAGSPATGPAGSPATGAGGPKDAASGPPALSLPGATDADPLADEHFIPPVPPPIRLDPATKGAWAGLFGGPGYLIVATIAGWSVPGWAAFCAVAAFIAGFTILVLRMGDDPPRDSGSGDGAVV